MKQLSRRDFIRLSATATAAGAAVAASSGTWAWLESRGATLPHRQAIAADALEESRVRTTCALCPSGCGLEVRVVNGKAVKVEGNPLHPLNQGVCCLKAQSSLEVLYSPERIQRPLLQTGERGGSDWLEITWDEALALVAEQLADLRQNGLAHTVAFLHGETRGQMRDLINRTYGVMLMAAGVDYAILDPLDEDLKKFIRIVNERDDSTGVGQLILALYDKTAEMDKLSADDVDMSDPEQVDIFKTVQILYNDVIYTDSYLRV